MVGPIPHGISKYVSFLAQSLKALDKKSPLPYRPIFLVGNEFKEDYFHSFDIFKIQAVFLDPHELIEIPKALKYLDASLYHSPSLSSLWNCPCPSIVTVHDLNH